MSNTWINVVSCDCPVGQSLSICNGKNSNIGQCVANTLTKYFIPAMLMHTFDLYQFLPFPQTLTLAGGHKLSGKQNLLASFSHTLFFQLIRINTDVMIKQFKRIFDFVFSEICVTKASDCCFSFTDCIKKKKKM